MKKKGRHITAVWQYGGFRLNLKLVLYLQSQCLTESLGFLNPPHRQAAGRYWLVEKVNGNTIKESTKK